MTQAQLPVLVPPERVQRPVALGNHQRVRVTARHARNGPPGEERNGTRHEHVAALAVAQAAEVAPGWEETSWRGGEGKEVARRRGRQRDNVMRCRGPSALIPGARSQRWSARLPARYAGRPKRLSLKLKPLCTVPARA